MSLYFKICVIGEQGVGKTTLIKSYLQEQFESSACFDDPDTFDKIIQKEKKKLRLTINEVPHPYEGINLSGSDFYGAEIIIFVFNTADFSSENILSEWWKSIEYAFSYDPKKFPSLILVGNIFSGFGEYDYKEIDIEGYPKYFNVIHVFKCDLKNTQYAEKIFTAALHEIIQRNLPRTNGLTKLVNGIDDFGPIFTKILCPSCKHLTSSGRPFCSFCNFRTDHEKI